MDYLRVSNSRPVEIVVFDASGIGIDLTGYTIEMTVYAVRAPTVPVLQKQLGNGISLSTDHRMATTQIAAGELPTAGEYLMEAVVENVALGRRYTPSSLLVIVA